jgi:hypothetical protein
MVDDVASLAGTLFAAACAGWAARATHGRARRGWLAMMAGLLGQRLRRLDGGRRLLHRPSGRPGLDHRMRTAWDGRVAEHRRTAERADNGAHLVPCATVGAISAADACLRRRVGRSPARIEFASIGRGGAAHRRRRTCSAGPRARREPAATDRRCPVGLPRPAHRPSEPGTVYRPARTSGGASATRTQTAGGAVSRSGQLQDGQR